MIRLDIIKIEDEKYPEKLRQIKNPPKQLYVEGKIELLNSHIISIVGSRTCSENGRKLAQQFARELVYQGITIASGMAIGIDTVAHQTTLQEKGKTIAVLGNGLNHIFPTENQGLYQEIIKNGGVIVTEYPPETKADSQKFLERNRIVSGLALGILVIEATYRSGTSVTAKLAEQQGRKIFALPHEVNNKYGVGTNRLIQNGAKIITNIEDIIKEFPFLSYKKMTKAKTKEIQKVKKVCKNKEYEKIYQLITEEIISLNEIYEKSNDNLTKINNILLMLELEGYIKKVAGGYTCILGEK